MPRRSYVEFPLHCWRRARSIHFLLIGCMTENESREANIGKNAHRLFRLLIIFFILRVCFMAQYLTETPTLIFFICSSFVFVVIVLHSEFLIYSPFPFEVLFLNSLTLSMGIIYQVIIFFSYIHYLSMFLSIYLSSHLSIFLFMFLYVLSINSSSYIHFLFTLRLVAVCKYMPWISIWSWSQYMPRVRSILTFSSQRILINV